MAKDFLSNNKKFNLYNPDPVIFDYFEKKKTVKEFNNGNEADFGRTFGPIHIDENFDGWITDMVLRVELPALLTEDENAAMLTAIGNDSINGVQGAPVPTYLNWVDNIGHALIESITLSAFGKEIITKKTDYGLWLDIYNELHDQNSEEWNTIGKVSATPTLHITKIHPSIIYVPLHFWFSKNNESAFPHFLVNKSNNIREMCLSISIKTRPLKNLIVTSGSVSYSTYKDRKIKSIQIIYDSIRANNNNGDSQLKNTIDSLYDSYKNINTPYRVYFDNFAMEHKPVENNEIICRDVLTDGPVKFIYFVFRKNARIADPDTSENTDPNLVNGSTTGLFTVKTNSDAELNPNDIFKYSSDDPGPWDTHDGFNYLTVHVDNDDKQWVTSNPKLDAIYYRRVVTLTSHGQVPQKHIYVIDFSNNKHKKDSETKINGYLNNNNNKKRSLKLEFDTPETDSTVTLIYVMINFFNVFVDSNNKLKAINNWGEKLPDNMTPTIFNDLKSSNSMNGTDGMFASKIWYNNGISTTILGLNPQWNQNFGKFGTGKISTTKDILTEPNIALKLAISLEGIANQNFIPTKLQANSVFGELGEKGNDIIDINKGDILPVKNNSIVRFNKNKQNNNLSKNMISVDLEGYNHKSLFIFNNNTIISKNFFQIDILNTGLRFTDVAFECFLTGNNNNQISKKTIVKNVYNKIRLMNSNRSDINILPGSFIYLERISDSLIVKMFVQSSGELITPIIG
jgi:hypothetical protein